MALKIKANTFATSRWLSVDSSGVTFLESALVGGKQHFGFGEIDCILMSPANELSFQVGQRVFSIPTKLKKKAHQQVISTLLSEVRRSAGSHDPA